VQATENEVLLYRGQPATTVYFSTSNGRTHPNELVFGGTPLPYLRGITERDDGASPVSRWTVRIPLGDLSRFLAADGRWSGRPIRKVRQEDGRIVVRGSRRRSTVVLDRAGLRDAVNDVAACLEPRRYPAREEPGYRLPQAVPSPWFRSHQEGTTLVVEGRGWGHGAGMVQWGAYGKAKRGLTYDRILATYYGGLRPQHADVPSTIRVLLATNLTSVTVVPSGEARVGSGRHRRRRGGSPGAGSFDSTMVRPPPRSWSPPASRRTDGPRRGPPTGRGCAFRWRPASASASRATASLWPRPPGSPSTRA
jgi:SpoIID/LytB domain protein